MITAVVPVSPIKSHPDTAILEQTVASIRHHLPTAEIVLTFDGVRPQQEDRRADYEEHIRRTLWLAKSWGPVYPFVFDEHLHQTGMLRRVLDDIRTPLMLYVEQDCPLVTDEHIEWCDVTGPIERGQSNLVRFHHEAVIPKPHMHLMHDHESGFPGSYALVRTSQWSQRPHVASVAYYRRIMDCYFTPEAKSFVEDKMHSVVQEAFKLDGIAGWQQHRLHIYDPGSGNMKRSYTTDGRAGEPKWDDTQVF